ncbi:MAG: hypothetical protein GY820_11150 [Gammaproteobacteria bacterium]|nr:hypothetical protein [Gammaproteobacteria bacterium]
MVEFRVPEETDINAKLFLEQINRGGLVSPSTIVFATCLKCWDMFSKLKKSEELSAKFLGLKNHKRGFMEIVAACLRADDDFCSLPDVCWLCDSSHPFLENISRRFFNCLMKNYVIRLSNSVRVAPANARKIRKLSSQ